MSFLGSCLLLMIRRLRVCLPYWTPDIEILWGTLLTGQRETAVGWGLKFLTTHPDAQTNLREALQDAFKGAVTEKRAPTAQEIATTNVPYLDAFMEETHRLGRTASSVIRRATCDTEILGFKVPKGTDVFMVRRSRSLDVASTSSQPLANERPQLRNASIRH